MAHPPPKVDLVLVFRASSKSLTKSEALENSKAAEAEYERLLRELRHAGLKATGRRGEKSGQLLVLIYAPEPTLARLVTRERHSDFLRGLPTSELPSLSHAFSPGSLSPADRIRLVHEYVTSTRADGGLGVLPGSKDWTRVESVMALHDQSFNDMWIRAWTRRQMGFGISAGEVERLKNQFGESVALYFSFLSTYTHALLMIAPLGFLFAALKLPYSTLYSTILVLWSTGFVEFWRLRERMLAVRWGTRGSVRVERRRAQYEQVQGGGPIPWWRRDMRIAASIPVILLFACALAALLTGIFVFEAFVTQLYTGPGHKLISFSPTILFAALVPQLLSIYQKYAVRLTEWENHSRQSTHEASLAIKTFALSAVVAYLGLALSAFVYVPFGESIMAGVHALFASSAGSADEKSGMWEASVHGAQGKLNPARLQNQMFAYTVTNQAINTFLEIGLPFLLRKADAVKSGKSLGHILSHSNGNGGKKKRVVFEDESRGEKEEREFLEGVRCEVALPEYTLFGDYSEMVTQFGYVAIWSTIWPLAPVMALMNNWLELRSDAFKITQHCRRPIPSRVDTIGPWLESLGFITWLAALTNSSLVYLFRPSTLDATISTSLNTNHPHTALPIPNSTFLASRASSPAYTSLVVPALIIALASSHAYLVARQLVRHVLVRVLWRGSREETQEENADRVVKEQYLKSLGLDAPGGSEGKTLSAGGGDGGVGVGVGGDVLDEGFWVRDEGLDEIQKASSKEA